jgi:hypothetical protein
MAGAAFIAWASAGLLAGQAGGQDAPAGQRLAQILAKAKVYCLRLETAALDFTCTERIEERTYAMRIGDPDVVIPDSGAGGKGAAYSYKPAQMPYYANTYVYDYQFVRRGEFKTEKRVLIEENGRKKNEKEAELRTTTIRVQNALFGPIGLVGEYAQSGHDYRIAGEETVKGKQVVIIEAVPKTGLERQHCYGRLWIREDDGGVDRIAWDQTSVGNFQVVQARAREYGAEPQLTSLTEYGLEKNGLRFPSTDTTEEAYLKSGQKHVQALTTILYKDYKFFTVETTVQY